MRDNLFVLQKNFVIWEEKKKKKKRKKLQEKQKNKFQIKMLKKVSVFPLGAK